jgi:hypothetical protein
MLFLDQYAWRMLVALIHNLYSFLYIVYQTFNLSDYTRRLSRFLSYKLLFKKRTVRIEKCRLTQLNPPPIADVYLSVLDN